MSYLEHNKHDIDFIVDLLITYGKCHLHKCRITKVSPNFTGFYVNLKNLLRLTHSLYTVGYSIKKKSNCTVQKGIMFFFSFFIFLFVVILAYSLLCGHYYTLFI